jgi:hypothetical protein
MQVPTSGQPEIIAIIDCDETVKAFLAGCNFEGRELMPFSTNSQIAKQW